MTHCSDNPLKKFVNHFGRQQIGPISSIQERNSDEKVEVESLLKEFAGQNLQDWSNDFMTAFQHQSNQNHQQHIPILGYQAMPPRLEESKASGIAWFQEFEQITKKEDWIESKENYTSADSLAFKPPSSLGPTNPDYNYLYNHHRNLHHLQQQQQESDFSYSNHPDIVTKALKPDDSSSCSLTGNEEDVRESAKELLKMVNLNDQKFRDSKFVKLVSDLANGTRILKDQEIIFSTNDYHDDVKVKATISSSSASSSFLAQDFNEKLTRKQEGWLESFNEKLTRKQEGLAATTHSKSNLHEEMSSDSLDGSRMATAPEHFYDFPRWSEKYLENISHLITAEEKIAWDSVEKGWKNHYATGFGYTGFALKHFGLYPISLIKASSESSPHSRWNEMSREEAMKQLDVLENENQFQDLISAIHCCLSSKSLQKSSSFKNEIWLKLSKAHISLENEHLAIAALHSLLCETSWSNLDALYRISILYANAKCLPEMGHAIEQWLRIKAKAFPSHELRQPLKMSFRNRKIPSTISGLLSKLISWGKPTDPEVSTLQSIIYDAFDMQDEAIAVLRDSTAGKAIDKNSWEIYNRLAAILLHKGCFEEAAEILLAISKVVPGQLRPLFNLAIAFTQMSDWASALKQIVRILREKTSHKQNNFINAKEDDTWKLFLAILDLSEVNVSLPEESREILYSTDLEQIFQSINQ